MDMTAPRSQYPNQQNRQGLSTAGRLGRRSRRIRSRIVKFLIDFPPHMRRFGIPCVHSPFKVRVPRGLSKKYWQEWRLSGRWPTSVRWCVGPLGCFWHDHHDLHACDESAGRSRPQPARRSRGMIVLVKSLRRICRHRYRPTLRWPSIAPCQRVTPHRNNEPRRDPGMKPIPRQTAWRKASRPGLRIWLRSHSSSPTSP